MTRTPLASSYKPVVRPAFGLHDPDRTRGYLFHEIVTRPGHLETITIGRSGRSDIRMRNTRVSRRHAVVYRGEDQFWHIRPSKPTNGLFVNGEPVVDSMRLLLGMRIRLAKVYLYTVNAQGLILVSGLDDDDYLANAGAHYGGNNEAARRVGKSHTTIGDRRSAPKVRKRLRLEREAAEPQKLTPSIQESRRPRTPPRIWKRPSSH